MAVFNNGTAGNDANKCILIIHHGDEILPTGPLHQVVHIRRNPDGDVIFPMGDLHDSVGLRLTDIHIA